MRFSQRHVVLPRNTVAFSFRIHQTFYFAVTETSPGRKESSEDAGQLAKIEFLPDAQNEVENCRIGIFVDHSVNDAVVLRDHFALTADGVGYPLRTGSMQQACGRRGWSSDTSSQPAR
jgi:hypothetical protein